MSADVEREAADRLTPEVYISFDQLVVSPDDGKEKATTSEGKARKTRRPDVAIYQPGAARRSAGRSQSTPLVTEDDKSPGPLPASGESSATSTRKKRPDQPKYVPKRSALDVDSTNAALTSEEGGNKQSPEGRLDKSLPDGKSYQKSEKRRRSKNKDNSGKASESREPMSKEGNEELLNTERTSQREPPVVANHQPEKSNRLNKHCSDLENTTNVQSVQEQRSGSAKVSDAESRVSRSNKERQPKSHNREFNNSKSAQLESGRTSRRQSDRVEQGTHKGGKESDKWEPGSSNGKTRSETKTEPKSDGKSVSFSDGGDADTSVNVSDLQENIAALSLGTPSNSGDTAHASIPNKTKPSGRATQERRKGHRGEGKLYHPSPNNEQSKVSVGHQKSTGGILRMPAPTDKVAAVGIDNSNSRTLYDPNQPASVVTARREDSDEVYQVHPGAAAYPSATGYPSVAGYSDPLYDPAYTVPVANPSPYSYNRSPYYTTEQPYTSTYTSPRQQKVSAIMRDVLPLERQLSSLISRRIQMTKESLEHINRLRNAVREKLEHALLVDLDYSTNHNLDQMLWKSVYHQMLENLRGQLQAGGEEGDTVEDIRAEVDAILDEAENNYKSLLTKLQRACQFDLSTHTTPQRAQPTNRSLKLALIMCQRLLICLGDIARYKTQNSSPLSVDYGRARKLYLQSSHVAPKNGKPYNQLAIIALHAKRRLDTVFYFMRSITASNAFLSAKESLQAIYNDVMKKYNTTRQEAEKRKEKARKMRQTTSLSSSHKRIEHWVSPIDGSSVTDHVDAEDDFDNPRKMPCNEVYRMLMTTFLSCQGMIYSKVGMERFPEASSLALYHLQALLSHSPLPQLDVSKLIQMFSLCMFSIYHSGLQADSSALDAEKCRSYTQEQAVLLFIDMSTVVIERCISLLSFQSEPTLSDLVSYDLLQLLPVVKLITDWMTCHPHLWNPPPCPRDPSLGPMLDPWLSIANLTNRLTILKDVRSLAYFTADEVDTDLSTHYIWLPLQEEIDLRGFLPLMNLANDDVFIKAESDVGQVAAAMCHRVKKLVTFADYLCGIEPPMLDFDTRVCKYKSLVDPPSLSEQTTVAKAIDNTQLAEEEDEPTDGSDSDSEDEGHSGGTTSELRRAKQRLSRQLAKQQKQQRLHQAVLESETHGAICLEIRPIFIVPDTNCFIEYPNQMRALITSHKFTVIVPLVVINELDGISSNKPSYCNARFSHSDGVRKEAADAIDFLEAQFESRNKRLKAVTVSGTELTSISFRTEETDAQGNNDDKILSCCLHYCRDNARDFMPKDKDKAVTLYRDVVLVTDDRNLRLKAHTRNVPVKDLVQFMEWAGIHCDSLR